LKEDEFEVTSTGNTVWRIYKALEPKPAPKVKKEKKVKPEGGETTEEVKEAVKEEVHDW
jgi:hypothetical protein